MALPVALVGLPWLRWLAYALALAGAAGWGAWKMHEHDAVAYNALTAEYSRFKGGVETAGRIAKEQAAAKEKADKEAKGKADEENRSALAAANDRIAKLRAAAKRNDSRGGSLSAAPAGSVCPQGQTCFDTALYSRAIGDYDERARRLADECTKVMIDFNTALEWAKGRP